MSDLHFRSWWDEAMTRDKIPHETRIKSRIRKLELNAGFPNRAVAAAYLEPTVEESKEPFQWSSPDLCGLRMYPFHKKAIGYDMVNGGCKCSTVIYVLF